MPMGTAVYLDAVLNYIAICGKCNRLAQQGAFQFWGKSDTGK
jgi:hypothetical protein